MRGQIDVIKLHRYDGFKMMACETELMSLCRDRQGTDVIRRIFPAGNQTTAYVLAQRLFASAKEVCRPQYHSKLLLACQYAALQFCNDSMTADQFLQKCGGAITASELGMIYKRVLSHVGFDLMSLL